MLTLSSCLRLTFNPDLCVSGRVARAGRGGTAFSLVCSDEVPFLYDLHLFLGRPIQVAVPEHTQGTANATDVRKVNSSGASLCLCF